MLHTGCALGFEGGTVAVMQIAIQYHSFGLTVR